MMTTVSGVEPQPPPGREKPCSEESILDRLLAFSYDESGAPAVEYAFLLALLAIALASGLKTFGLAVRGLLETASSSWAS